MQARRLPGDSTVPGHRPVSTNFCLHLVVAVVKVIVDVVVVVLLLLLLGLIQSVSGQCTSQWKLKPTPTPPPPPHSHIRGDELLVSDDIKAFDAALMPK